ncbi:hypothetical protein L211DRAFT_369758 [Terfezia boudieri ATCC MYA-4762]|uniref:Uncharacterized protein n=1 Tax=Terfezia boudieri ATCC MYA-4762 TaxID=1051890 RepID=A0A3N4LZB4_9PEZI|nr:hypothetical protein L211DRAFT_369758 [Terfezia boudieri ATCC MYA-4762]
MCFLWALYSLVLLFHSYIHIYTYIHTLSLSYLPCTPSSLLRHRESSLVTISSLDISFFLPHIFAFSCTFFLGNYTIYVS